MTNPIVFFDISFGSSALGRVKMELFADKLPKTSENFRQFCIGEYRLNGVPQGYKNCKFHRVIKGFMIQGGDFVMGNGMGSQSIYGSTQFDDEGFPYSHEPMMLSMANSGPNTNGCQFFICCKKLDHLNGKHVVFGKVVEGQDIVRKIEQAPTNKNDQPYPHEIIITNCGEM